MRHFDIRKSPAMALDGPLSVDKGSRALLETSLSAAMVKSDDQGNTRLVKKGQTTCVYVTTLLRP